ncbi:MAG: peptide deformylase [Clostridiales bacterium]|nr:peptide deformylase [Clostridiales bacterium]MCF8022718.1 peptide deformylase [Clostridiales bacterium]
MAVYKIVVAEDEILRKKAKQVPSIENNIYKLLDNMKDTMYEYNGVGLAAPQIGISKRVIIVDVGKGLIELINPKVESVQGSDTQTEGCLSVPGVLGDVHRPLEVQVSGLNRKGEEVSYNATGLFARALQHEIDHLNGILFIDKSINLRKEK